MADTGHDVLSLRAVRRCLRALSALGAQVEAGAPAGRIHDLDDPGAEPRTVCFARAGVQFCRRGPARVERGNCLAVVAVPDAD